MARSAQEAPDREWVSFEDDEEERTWVFDVTFLTSRWSCIYGNGCQGVLTGPAPELAQGCCSYGAHFTDDDDVDRVVAAADDLADEDWQFHSEGRRRGVIKTLPGGETATRLAQDACVFLNRPDFPGGAGCALHRAALRTGARPMDLKPNVCWQLPLRREDRDDGGGRVTSTVTEWARINWGSGGEEFHWWCTETPDAFVGSEAVYQSLRHELVGLIGQPVYDRLSAYLDDRVGKVELLPHPAVRS